MDIFEAINERYSCRAYQDKSIQAEKLERVLEAARLAPSARNFQDWRFVLVTDSGTDRFRAELFHFGKEKRPMTAELYLLKTGRYSVVLTTRSASEQTPLASHDFTMEGLRTQVAFELPPQTLCTLNIRRQRTAEHDENE